MAEEPKLTSVNLLVHNQVRKMRNKFRKIVTGDENKRIRDLIDEKREIPSYVKLAHKIFFTFGVFSIAIFQYFMLNAPKKYWICHSVTLAALMVIRFREWTRLKWQYFMLDFCYFTNVWLLLCCFFNLERFPTFFNACFICSVGPLPMAILVWRISLVFHEYDKVTSILIHILPLMLCYTMRWHGSDSSVFKQSLEFRDYLTAAGMYLLWQVLYFWKTEVKDKEKLDRDLEIQTSLRMLSTDRKNAFTQAVLRGYRAIGVMRQNEEFEPTELKTKVIFMLSQFLYTLVTFIPAPFLYVSKWTHLYYIAFIFWVSTYFGAGYYIEIFSKRYQLQFEESKKIQRLVQAASEVAFDTANEVFRGKDTDGNSDLRDTHGSRSATLSFDSAAAPADDAEPARALPVSEAEPGPGAAVTKRDILKAAAAVFVDKELVHAGYSPATTYSVSSSAGEGVAADSEESNERSQHDKIKHD
jgi:hypothetical protein